MGITRLSVKILMLIASTPKLSANKTCKIVRRGFFPASIFARWPRAKKIDDRITTALIPLGLRKLGISPLKKLSSEILLPGNKIGF